RQHQAESHGSGPSRSEPDIDGREDKKQDLTEFFGPPGNVNNKESYSSGAERSSADNDGVGGAAGAHCMMTEEAIAKIWEQGPPKKDAEAWTYYYF
ncbi:unnamed protein product, partial [Ascophyllum nodosum]